MDPESTTPENDGGNDETEGTTPEGKTYSESYVRSLRGEAGDYRRKLREAEERLAEFENAGKSELEKLTERLSQAENMAGTAAQEAARLRVALAKGLNETQAKRLVGSTIEELEADADELLKAFGAVEEEDETPGRMPDGTPRERLRSGAVPAAEPEELDPAKLAAQIRRPYV